MSDQTQSEMRAQPSAVDQAQPKKGFRNKKKPNNKALNEENDKLRNSMQQVFGIMNYVSQVSNKNTQDIKFLLKENEALTSIIQMDKLSSGTVQEGDAVLLACIGYLKNEDGTLGEAFEGGYLSSTLVRLGAGGFVPGFEEKLVGKVVGTVSDLEITFPEEYSEELKGKDAVFKVLIINIFRDRTGMDAIFNLKMAEDQKKADKMAEEAKERLAKAEAEQAEASSTEESSTEEATETTEG